MKEPKFSYPERRKKITNHHLHAATMSDDKETRKIQRRDYLICLMGTDIFQPQDNSLIEKSICASLTNHVWIVYRKQQ